MLAAALLATGALLLPFAVYAVGQQVFGEYGADGSVGSLLLAVWSGLVQGNPLAWILVLSPYAVIQLFRVSWHLFRRSGSPS